MSVAFDIPIGIEHIAVSHDGDGRIVGFLIGKHFAMAENFFRRETREFEELCAELISGVVGPRTQQVIAQSKLALAPKIDTQFVKPARIIKIPRVPLTTKERTARGNARDKKNVENLLAARHAGKSRCEALLLCRSGKYRKTCDEWCTEKRDGHFVCWTHMRAATVSFE